MLLLDVKLEGEVQIGPEVRLKLVSVGKARAKLGITAPADVKISRLRPSGRSPEQPGTVEAAK